MVTDDERRPTRAEIEARSYRVDPVDMTPEQIERLDKLTAEADARRAETAA